MRFLLAIAVVLASVGAHADEIDDAMNGAIQQAGNGNFAEALPLAEEAYTLCVLKHGRDGTDVLDAAVLLADIYIRIGLPEKAEPLLKQSLATIERVQGEDSDSAVGVLVLLGRTYSAGQSPKDAEPFLLRALAIYDSMPEADDVELILCLDALATLYREKLDQPAKAEPILLRMLDISRRVIGPDHLGIADQLDDLARFYLVGLRQPRKAIVFLQQEIAIKEKALGPTHPQLAELLGVAGGLFADAGDLINADASYRRSLAMREAQLGPNDVETLRARHQLKLFESVYGVRRWSSAKGGFQRSGRFAGVADDKVTIQLDGGGKNEVPLEQLSQEDQRFVKFAIQSLAKQEADDRERRRPSAEEDPFKEIPENNP